MCCLGVAKHKRCSSGVKGVDKQLPQDILIHENIENVWMRYWLDGANKSVRKERA